MSGREPAGAEECGAAPWVTEQPAQSSLHSRPAPESRRAGGAPGEQRGGDTQAGRAWGRRVAHDHVSRLDGWMFRASFAPTCV